ncbi:MAG: tetratricopeptide repeat protein [Pseudomonadota bacterium]
MTLLTELRRRNVFRVTAAYLVVGWLLTEVLTTILPTLGAPDWTGRAVILVFALGFVPAVMLSWVYQLTPDGIRRDRDVKDSHARPRISKVLDYVVIASVVALVLALGVIGSRQDEALLALAPAADAASVAVLPFQDMSPDQDHEYLADGLTETLLHMLAQVPDLQVAARTSCFAFKGKNMDISVIAKALRVAHVLEGSIQRSGDKVRVTAQLIRAEDGFHVFSSTFDRQIDDIFAIQDEIAVQVREELSASILGAPAVAVANAEGDGAGTLDAEAYQLYLQAVSQSSSRSVRGLQAAERLLTGALAIDPGYLDAKTELATNYLRRFEAGLLPAAEAAPQIYALLAQVLAAQPEDNGARAIQAYVQTNAELATGATLAVDDAVATLETIVARAPKTYRIRSLLGRLLRSEARYDEAIATQLAGLEQDPYNAEIYFELGSVYALNGQPDDARQALGKALELDPGQSRPHVQLANLARRDGNAVGFVRELIAAVSADAQDYETAGALATFLYRLGLVEEGDEFRDRVLAIAPTSEIAYVIERVRALTIGDEPAASAAARRAIEDAIDNRLNGYAGAVRHLLAGAVRHNQVEEAVRYLERLAPAAVQPDAPAPGGKGLAARIAALPVLAPTLSAAERVERVAALRRAARARADNPFDDPAQAFVWLALEDRLDAATEALVSQTLTQSVLLHLDWPERQSLPAFEALMGRDSVKVGIAAWQAELAAARKELVAYLATIDAGQ